MPSALDSPQQRFLLGLSLFMIEIHFTAPTNPWSLNAERSMHWATRARHIKAWRTVARHAASLAPELRELGPCQVTVHLSFPRRARRDPSNYLPPCKAAIDGLVDAGLWPDDNADWVTVAEPVLEIRDDGMVRVVLTPLTPQS
jgi:Holliday junction resolvase RusA-like endonuclease